MSSSIPKEADQGTSRAHRMLTLRTKSQIAYFRDRIQEIGRRILAKMFSQVPEAEDLTTEQKLGMILNGRATLKQSLLDDLDECANTRFFSAYNYPADDDIVAYNKARRAWIDTAREHVRADLERLIDICVMDGEANLAAVCEDLRLRDYSQAVPFTGIMPACTGPVKEKAGRRYYDETNPWE